MAEKTKFTFSFNDKYTAESGTIILSGLQALARLPLDQRRADQRAGLHTAAFISGYRGSPLAGLDMVFEEMGAQLRAQNIVFQPGVNEDLAATSVFGSQIANLLPNPKYDGVLGMWYGKAPGVDRSGDIFKHANFTGVGRYGGVLALAGDDPTAKSSTLPSASEVALYDASMPILYPGDIGEVLRLGRLGFELSRYCGAWVGFKVVTDVADGFGTATIDPALSIVQPEFTFRGKAWAHTQDTRLVAPFSLTLEYELYEGRMEAARRFAAANGLNPIVAATGDDWIGIVAAGKTYFDLREALDSLGLDDDALNRGGIRLLKLEMLYPLEPTGVRSFARGLERILVIEEKRPFVELFIRDALYNQADHPFVVGKRDEADQPLVRIDSEIDADQIAAILVRVLADRLPAFNLRERLTARQGVGLNLSVPLIQVQGTAARAPYFCSGCPHNRSTNVPEGSIAAGGIGCHTLALTMERHTEGITHMGGEGAQWIGAAAFSNTPHIFQNLGDGTLFHSGYLAIRASIAANVNITYKILYNAAVAMTGAQQPDGAMPVPALTRALQAEGVRQIIVCADDPDKYPPNAEWAHGVTVWSRDRLDEAQIKLRDVSGVTALIYDQPCAADLRRKRKRGEAPEPERRVLINESVCEGCGDCGVKSNCLSVVPVDTEFGRKTQIHQASCNKDYTCLEGDCPSFVTVIPAKKSHPPAPSPDLQRGGVEVGDLPEPARRIDAEHVNLFMVGIGGTGVVTVNQILATAAFLEGKQVRSLDQTGLSQKGGPVSSHLKISVADRAASNKIGTGEADAYLAFDLLHATTDSSLSHAARGRTVAIISTSEVATGTMVRSTAVAFPPPDYLRRRLESRTDPAANLFLDAATLSENLFGSHMYANMIVIGAAYQAGLIPLAAETIEAVIALNGVTVSANVSAFRLGRKRVVEPDWLPATVDLKRKGDLVIAPPLDPTARALIESIDSIDSIGASAELRRLLEIRVPELIAFQSVGYARKYVALVRIVREREVALTDSTLLSEAVARYLFKLMAYKDEYEVARLHTRPEFQRELTAQFGVGAKLTYRLHPPFMRALGFKNKIGFGRWFEAGYWLLKKMKPLRGTPFDPFGYAGVRRTERALIGEYRALIQGELAALTPETYAHAVKVAELPDLIRGYEGIKMANVDKFRRAALALKG